MISDCKESTVLNWVSDQTWRPTEMEDGMPLLCLKGGDGGSRQRQQGHLAAIYAGPPLTGTALKGNHGFLRLTKPYLDWINARLKLWFWTKMFVVVVKSDYISSFTNNLLEKGKRFQQKCHLYSIHSHLSMFAIMCPRWNILFWLILNDCPWAK